MISTFTGQNIRNLAALMMVFALILVSGDVQAQADLQGTHQTSGLANMQTAAPSGVIVVKMAVGFSADKTAATLHLAQTVQHLLQDASIEPRFPNLSKNLSGSELRRYYQIETKNLDRTNLLKLLAGLNSDHAIEVAFLEPIAVPAAEGFDAFTGAVPEVSQSSDTPDFSPDQGYLADAPLGVGALAMRAQDGATGTGVTIIDVEGGWLWTHEDLPAATHELGSQVDALSWRNHGTAVVSEMRGQDNGFGVTGIVPDCMVGSSGIGAINTAGALAAAVDVLQRGDLILIELHAPGPNADGNGQFGYVPMEFWPDNFDIIRLATAKGIIVCEAAGNGYQNLDGAEYLGLFDRTVRDSGAIMCGATEGDELFSAGFSNNGSRVDLNGWGRDVTAAGYGNLQNGDETQWYTYSFSGTSSASPIVTGSVASLQGMVLADWGIPLDARLARDILLSTGTTMVSGTSIGSRPNLEAAFAHADTIIGAAQGIVTDEISGLPIEGVTVQVSGNGSFTTTDASGYWQIPLVEGSVDLEFSSYFYHSQMASSWVAASVFTSLNQAMTPLQSISITGQVFGANGPVAGVQVTPTDQPVSGDTTDPNGFFSILVPALYDFTLLFDGVPGYGATVAVVSTAGLMSDVEIEPVLPFTSENFHFDDGGFMATSGHWTHGVPPVAITGGAFDASACWGIGMDGDYGDNENDTLLSPSYNLSAVGADNYFLSFHYFSATEAGFDGVNLEILDGENFVLQIPLEGYTDASLGGLGGSAGWSGNSDRWHGTVFDISQHTSPNFQFRLNFGSDSGLFMNGFYIDAISFGLGQLGSLVGATDLPAPTRTQLKAWPNPFNPQVNLEYTLTRPGLLQVEVFDLRGNLVRTLFNAPVSETSGNLRWDGRQDNGRPASSGLYLVRMTDPDNRTTSQRVVLAK